MRKNSILQNLGILPVLLVLFNLPAFSQLVTNTNTGSTYSTIQAAIDAPATLNGHILKVAAGVYAENVLVNKELTINGPKVGVDGNDALRGTGEAVIIPPTKWYGDGTMNGGYLMRVTADNVTVDGLTLNGDNTSVEIEYSTTTGAFDIDFGIMSYWNAWYEYPYPDGEGYDASADLTGNNLTIQNNVLKNFKLSAIIMVSDYYNPIAKAGKILHNKVQNAAEWPAINLGMNYYANIENNTIVDARTAIHTGWYWLEKSVSTTGTIKNNSINLHTIETNWGLTYSDVKGVSITLVYNGISDSWSISNNTFTNTSTRSINSRGLDFNIDWTPGSLTIADNIINGFESGYSLRNCSDAGFGLNPPTQSLTISGGTVSNCSYGILSTNLSEYYGHAGSSVYNIKQVTFLNNTEAGIFVDDESSNPINTDPSTVAAHANNCKFTGNPVALKFSGTYAFGSAHNNDLASASSFAINNLSPNTINATCNWYGHWTGPTNTTNPGGTGTKVSSLVTFDPWVTNGTDNNPPLAGFQPVPGSCVPIKCGTNNKKYLLCHNGMNKCFGYDDALIHIAHGDPFGACTPASITNAGNVIPETMLPEKLSVSSFPNPFINTTTLKYELPFDSKVVIKVYDVMGKEVASLINSEKKAGVYTVNFDASRLSKGMYYYKLTASTKEKEYTQSGKMLKQ